MSNWIVFHRIIGNLLYFCDLFTAINLRASYFARTAKSLRLIRAMPFWHTRVYPRTRNKVALPPLSSIIYYGV